MKLRFVLFALSIFVIAASVFGQTNSNIGQISNAPVDSYAGSISGDGRFVVFESRGDLDTINPHNSDGNTEIYLWDFAQRRIFQITDTKAVLKNTFGVASQENIKVDILNKRPVISQNGRWIAFASNATASTVTVPDTTNPGSFDGNAYNTQAPPPCTLPTPSPTPTPTATPSPTPTPTGSPSPTPTPSPTSTPFNNPLSCDANMELWLYQIPAYAPADLTSGDELGVTDLSTGSFINITNSIPSRLPQSGTSISAPFVADDNHDASIDDDGSTVAFVSTRDLIPGGNSFPTEDNDEIFTYTQAGGGAIGETVQVDPSTVPEKGLKKNGGKSAPSSAPVSMAVGGGAVISQVTRTTRGVISNPIYNKNPTISGPGNRVLFASTGDNPIIGMTGGNNPLASRNEELFYADLNGSGAPSGNNAQVTVTTPTNPGEPVNLLEFGKRMSRDGSLIAFDSFADLANENSGTNYGSFATYLYDTAANTFRRIGARSDADTQAAGGDVPRYPGFTDYDSNGTPATLVLETRLNIKADGTVAATQADGLNPEETRPVQLYNYPLTVAPAAATFTRFTKFPISTGFLAQTQPLTSDSSTRFAFNMGLTELGGGNPDLLSEAFYLYVPPVNSQTEEPLMFSTGATGLAITPTLTASPTPSPTATPMNSPTPTPTPTPTGSPSPTPTPVTPDSVRGISPGMLARLTFDPALSPPVTPRTAAGSLTRTFNLPFELSGVTLTIGGYACGLKSVDSNGIVFVAPIGLIVMEGGAVYPSVVNNQGTAITGFVTMVPGRPDIFNDTGGPGGRAQAQNVTNRVYTTEPFTVTTVLVHGGVRVPTLIRLRMTGIAGFGTPAFTIRLGSVTIPATAVKSAGILVEPGVYTVDFELPATLNNAGDVPIVVSVTAGTTTFTSRLDDTAPRIRIL